MFPGVIRATCKCQLRFTPYAGSLVGLPCKTSLLSSFRIPRGPRSNETLARSRYPTFWTFPSFWRTTRRAVEDRGSSPSVSAGVIPAPSLTVGLLPRQTFCYLEPERDPTANRTASGAELGKYFSILSGWLNIKQITRVEYSLGPDWQTKARQFLSNLDA